jgi:hypothetical protein
MFENSREDTLKMRQKGIDLYRPYDKSTILPGGTDMGFKKTAYWQERHYGFLSETVILFV